jgi:hypothetical protein
MTKTVKIAALAAALTLAPACGMSQLEIPSTPDSLERHQVRGVSGLRLAQRVRFAEFETAPVRRSWTRSRGISLMGFGVGRASQGYDFELSGGGERLWAGSCRTHATAGVVEVRGGEVSSTRGTTLVCRLAPLDEERVEWSLTVPAGARLPQGLVTSDAGEIRIVASNRLVGTLPAADPAGYHLYDGERLLASVEVINGGAVIFQRGISPTERRLAGAIATSLLLMDDMSDPATPR